MYNIFGPQLVTFRTDAQNGLDIIHKFMSTVFVSQVDKQLASGEYFLKEKEKRLKAQEEKKVLTLFHYLGRRKQSWLVASLKLVFCLTSRSWRVLRIFKSTPSIGGLSAGVYTCCCRPTTKKNTTGLRMLLLFKVCT